jgi:hypothetical protein
MAQWKIRRRQGECSACEHVFEDGERHASLLRIDGDELQRGDLCDACWAAHETGGDDLIWWFTHHEENKKRTLALDLATMERLFMELADRDTDQLKEVRYLLCLLLMRKRRLKLERVKRVKGAELLVMRRPRRKEQLEVQVFDFNAERMDELRTRLQEVLEGTSFEEGGDESIGEEETGEDLQAPVSEAREAVGEADDAEASGDADGAGDGAGDAAGDAAGDDTDRRTDSGADADTATQQSAAK